MTDYRRVVTEDGSVTVYHPAFDEDCHSRIGARKEALLKFIQPVIENLDADRESLFVLDACFGLGYNSFALIAETERSAVSLRIIAVENDEHILAELPLALDTFSGSSEIRSFRDGRIRSGRVKLDVLKQDLLSYLADATEGEGLDIIFHDPFSPVKCPELWTVEVFKKYYAMLNERGLVVTYSASGAVRAGMLEAGFSVRETSPAGRRQGGTLAGKAGDMVSDEGILEMYRLTTAAVPYRSGTVNEELTSWRSSVLQKWEDEKNRLTASGEVRTVKQFLKGK